MKWIKISLLGRIAIAIILALLLGYAMPAWVGLTIPSFITRCFLTFNAIFAQFLGFVIPLVILALVAEAIGSIGMKAGRMLLITVAIAYGSTVFSGYLAFLTGSAVFPRLITPEPSAQMEGASAMLSPYFTIDMPPVMGVTTALILAFILGLGVARGRAETLRGLIVDVKNIITDIIEYVIIPLLPLYIFGVFLGMTADTRVLDTLVSFAKVIGVIFFLLVLQYVLAGAIAGKNPFRSLGRMLPAYFTALGTASSAATIPVTLAQAQKNDVSEEVASFVIPLCATIHLSGSMLKIVSCALALMVMTGLGYDVSLFTEFILMLGITMVAAPGVPGGAIMAALPILKGTLGFDDPQLALMISLYIAMDSFGTACNVTGDGAIAMVVDRLSGRKK